MIRVRRALLSVTDKAGLPEFAEGLAGRGVELVSTGGTAKVLSGRGLPVIEVAQVTGFPEMMDGRVKTLHPLVHGGILAIRGNPEHEAALSAHGITPIDCVCVNLYAFEKTVARPGCTFDEAVENIDIGGPALIRAAAKNHRHVAVVTDPADYPAVLAEMDREGGVTEATALRLAAKAFRLTHEYDGAIARYLSGVRP